VLAGRQLAARCLFVCLSARLVFVDRYTNTGRAGLVAVDQVLAGLVLAGLVLAGLVLAGLVLAGLVLAGLVLAGLVLAGLVLAGLVLAGLVPWCHGPPARCRGPRALQRK
jgi:hypothetical protein